MTDEEARENVKGIGITAWVEKASPYTELILISKPGGHEIAVSDTTLRSLLHLQKRGLLEVRPYQ